MPQLRADAGELWNSSTVARDTRWGLPLPSRTYTRADMNAVRGGVDAQHAVDSVRGSRHVLGTVWVWTSSAFEPLPGYEPDLYKDNSDPQMGSRKAPPGGSSTTGGRLLRNTLGNYFPPDRRDAWTDRPTDAQ